ncbi:MAG: squalene/phytoene synthase family protein [Hyphomicrobium sp.]
MSEASSLGSVMSSDQAVRDAARSGAADRYLSALLAPRSVRADLIALAAFSSEIEKIAMQVTEPHLGEIRTQWWRDVLSVDAGVSGHPVADAFTATIRRHALPHERIDDFLDAHVHALYADPPADDRQLQLELDLREGVLFALAAHILGAPGLDPASGIIHDAAQAYGLARLGMALPFSLARGRVPVPVQAHDNSPDHDWRMEIAKLNVTARRHMEHVRSAYGAERSAVKAALLPVALVEPYLRALSQASNDPARDITDIAPLTRVWRLAKTHLRGRV